MSFGAKLRVEREARKVSLAEVAAATKVGTRYLQAIEEEAIERLPGGIFNKGFVRAYAEYLGLDAEELVNDLVAASPSLHTESVEPAPVDSAVFRWLATLKLPQ